MGMTTRARERFFPPGYAAHLVESWIPALDGLPEKLLAGAIVADVGCGHGVHTVIMAKAYPNSRFFGFDHHASSLTHARELAADAGVSHRIIFAVARATSFPGGGYDLITYFGVLRDAGDPEGALRHARQALGPGGHIMIVEPIPSRGEAVGTIGTEQALREVATAAGFSHFRRATETPFNRIFETRP